MTGSPPVWPRFVIGEDGAPLSSTKRQEWLSARQLGVCATDARKLILSDGRPSAQRRSLVKEKLTSPADLNLAQFLYGREREELIARWVCDEFGIEHNTFLCAGVNARHMATPDGVGNQELCEIKTSSKSFEKTLRSYRDQLLWQLHVTGADRVLLVVEQRTWQDTTFHFQRQTKWVYRDEARISLLARAADDVLAELDAIQSGVVAPPPVGFIYTLTCVCHPDEGIRYVGLSEQPLLRRFRQHVGDAKRPDEKRKPVHAWMREHNVENIRIELLEEVTDSKLLRAREARWIAHLRGHGCRLLNANGFWTVGQDGVWHRADRESGQPIFE